MGNSSVEYRGESDLGVPAAGSFSRFPQPALPVIYFCVTDPSFHGEFANYISGLHGIYKRKKQLNLSCFWYSVGESNPYCKIENLEY